MYLESMPSSSDEIGALLPSSENNGVENDPISRSIDCSVNKFPIYLVCFCLALGNAVDAVEIMCIGYIITEIPNVTSTDQELLTSAVFIGMLMGGIFCGFLSDQIGRRPTLLLSFTLNMLSGFLSVISPNVHWLIAFRVIGGLG